MKRSGFTLVETLLAVVLGSAVLTVASSIAVQSVRARYAVRRELQDRWCQAYVLDTFEADVRQAIRDKDGRYRTLEVPEEPGKILMLETLVWDDSSEGQFARRTPARVTYVYKPSPDRDMGGTLFRDVLDLTDPRQIVHRSTLSNSVTSASVEWFDGREWTSNAPNLEKDRDPPRGVRLVCRWHKQAPLPGTRVVDLALDDEQNGSGGHR